MVIILLTPFIFFGKLLYGYLIIYTILILVILKKKTKIKLIEIVKNRADLRRIKFYLLIMISVGILFNSFYEALNFISHSFPDTESSYRWILSNLEGPGLFYSPGLSIISFPSIYLIDPFYSLNYFSGAIGLVTVVCLNLILQKIISFPGLIVFNSIIIHLFNY